jgi:hypothetical protein
VVEVEEVVEVVDVVDAVLAVLAVLDVVDELVLVVEVVEAVLAVLAVDDVVDVVVEVVEDVVVIALLPKSIASHWTLHAAPVSCLVTVISVELVISAWKKASSLVSTDSVHCKLIRVGIHPMLMVVSTVEIVSASLDVPLPKACDPLWTRASLSLRVITCARMVLSAGYEELSSCSALTVVASFSHMVTAA